MNESTIGIAEAEIIPETSLVKVDELRKLIKEQDLPVYNVVEHMDNLDWTKMKPHYMALILMSKPFSVRGGGTTYLTFRQSLYFAVRCFELGVSPFSDEVFFDPAKFSVNLTLAGKKVVARNKGIDLGPPLFEELSRDWKDVPRMTQAAEAAKKAGFTKDVGIKCHIRVGDPKCNEHASYTAYLSEWYMPSSPVWQEKPIHMLQTRSTEKCISLVLGTGASSMVGGEPDGE